jgi:hypothetical protein
MFRKGLFDAEAGSDIILDEFGDPLRGALNILKTFWEIIKEYWRLLGNDLRIVKSYGNIAPF